MHYNTVAHHLRVLEDLGYVHLRKFGGRIHCFENHGKYGAQEVRVHAAAQTPAVRSLLAFLLQNPGARPAEAARHLGIARSSLKHHADRLTGMGVLEIRQEGTGVQLHVAKEAVDSAVAVLQSPATLTPSGQLGSR